MLGRGVKRKWSCLEELEAEVVTEEEKEQPQQQQQQHVEEKEEEEKEEERADEGPSKPDMSHLQQRQLVLGLCLEKLQRYQAGVELSLRRSVLLINTIRQIQEEMQSDNAGSCGDVPPDSRLLRDDFRMEVEVAVTCPGCAEEDSASPPPPPTQTEPSPQESNVAISDQPKPPPAISTFSDAVNAMGYLSDLALDDIFEDIDTSMYETSELPSGWTAGSLWPVSVSLWPDEDVKLRASGHSATPLSLQSCLTDLNELDHIMEILVKS